jgi:hypothetical protein
MRSVYRSRALVGALAMPLLAPALAGQNAPKV